MQSRSRISLAGAFALLVAIALPSAAQANDYLSTDTADWFRYTNAATQQQVESQIQLTVGAGWRMWDEFAGLGPRWVFTDAAHDWMWIFNGQDTVLVGDLGNASGHSFVGRLDAVNDGRMRVASAGETLTTPAGTFNDVSRVTFETQATDAGVTEIWFAKGIGVVKWTEQSIAGPQTLELSTAMVAGVMHPNASTPARPPAPTPTPTPTPTPGPLAGVAPAEFEESDSILWGANDTYLVVPTYADSFRALDGQSPRILSDVSVASQHVASQLRYEMTSRNVPMNDVEIFVTALDSVWMRDYGPITFRDNNGARVVGDPEYFYNRPNDDAFPRAYAQYRGWNRVAINLSLEGGNFLTDGRGQGFVTRGVRMFNPGMSLAAVERELFKLGLDRVEILEPLVQEGTTHIDMFAKIVSDTKAVVSSYPAGHRQVPIVNAATQKLESMGYSVERVMAHIAHDEFASYSNSLIANDIVLVPQYGSAALDQAAIDAYARTGLRAIGVNTRNLILYGGAVHCITMQVPAR